MKIKSAFLSGVWGIGGRGNQGQISAQGILHLRNMNLGPNSGKLILNEEHVKRSRVKTARFTN